MDAVTLQLIKKYIASKISCDFVNSDYGNWTGTVIATGTICNVAGTGIHPGIIQHISSASANSGSRIMTEATSFLLAGREKTTIVFQTTATLAGVTRRMGFHNSSSEAVPTDGVYFKLNGDVLTGQTINNTTGSTTGTSYTVAASTWYRAVIELNADATLATFILYADNSTTVLWTNTLATNIPKDTGREVGHGDNCTILNPGVATVAGWLDYMDIVLPNARRVI